MLGKIPRAVVSVTPSPITGSTGGQSVKSISAAPSPVTVSTVKQGVKSMEEQLQELRAEVLEEFKDIFIDELGEADCIVGDPVKLEVREDGVTPYHCWTPASVSAHHKHEARRMVEHHVQAGILEEVSWPTKWCSHSFFIEKLAIRSLGLRW